MFSNSLACFRSKTSIEEPSSHTKRWDAKFFPFLLKAQNKAGFCKTQVPSVTRVTPLVTKVTPLVTRVTPLVTRVIPSISPDKNRSPATNTGQFY